MLYLLKRFKNCLIVRILPVIIMNTLHGYGQSIQQTNEQNQSAMTIAHSEASLSQLKQQVRIGGISLNRDPITMAPFEVKTKIVSDLPHTQINPEIDRGPVGKIQEKKTNMSEKRRARVNRKEKKKQLRAKD